MSTLTILLFNLYGLSSPITMIQRCGLLDTAHLVTWVESERKASAPTNSLSRTSKRPNPWLPDVSLSAGVTLNDGDQYRILEAAQSTGLRTSAVSEGGQRTQYQLRLKWFLSTHATSANRLSWRKSINQEQVRSRGVLQQVIQTFGRWVKHLDKRCQQQPVKALDSVLFTLELELEHLSDGRFYQWLKEKI